LAGLILPTASQHKLIKLNCHYLCIFEELCDFVSCSGKS